jgi:hypothetical protein
VTSDIGTVNSAHPRKMHGTVAASALAWTSPSFWATPSRLECTAVMLCEVPEAPVDLVTGTANPPVFTPVEGLYEPATDSPSDVDPAQ